MGHREDDQAAVEQIDGGDRHLGGVHIGEGRRTEYSAK